ncbi:unnamed protein product [Pieris macdunnoughi]|uniref:Cytochrome P450 n=1 Tax=Pieris macdunnoughi TaxID=345717 RepID=A0A821NT52_9NEOP|nr:unnamed protein product [Pieris macdunnoughi]
MFTIILFTLLAILCLVEVLVNFNENARTLKKIPGFKDVFFFGNSTVVFGMDSVRLFKFGRECAKKFNGIYRFYSLSIAAVNVFNPSDAEIVMSTMKHHEKSIIYKFIKPWLHDGLLVSKGSKWQERRKILTSAFHFNILRKYFLIIEENSQKLVNVMEKNSGESVDIVPILSEYTLNSISESAMGVELDKDPINVINKRKQNFQNNEKESGTLADNDSYVYKKKSRAAMLDLLISAEKEGLINDDGIIEEVNTFMFEGHDTTAAGLTFCLLTLAENQDVQEKVYQELQSIFNGRDDVTLEDLTMMNYLERCIKESMRLYPPVPFISRTLSETVKLSNYTVPVGTMCHIHIYDMHRQESLFKNAEKFDPDRFLPENSVGRHPYSYIPFSAGPRNCIGQKFAMMEMKSALSALLKNYKLLPVTTSKDLEFVADLVLRNSKPIYLKFIKRH